MSQNIWEQAGYGGQRQRRRAEIVKATLRSHRVRIVLDAGCAEGYATRFISDLSDFVVGLELNLETLNIAKKKVNGVSFINASIKFLPFRDNIFDAICMLEVLEHMDLGIQRECIKEANRVLESNGLIVISIPYKEKVINTNCIHCGKLTPLYGHLQSLDEHKITSLLSPYHFSLTKMHHLPNVGLVSCSRLFKWLPLPLWLIVNKVLGLVRKGYWIILQYKK
jgi:ubiquinone/menaquinone biosynthesis C-methylase UbiE